MGWATVLWTQSSLSCGPRGSGVLWVASGNQRQSDQTGDSRAGRVCPPSSAFLGVWWWHFRTYSHRLLEVSEIRTALLLKKWVTLVRRGKNDKCTGFIYEYMDKKALAKLAATTAPCLPSPPPFPQRMCMEWAWWPHPEGTSSSPAVWKLCNGPWCVPLSQGCLGAQCCFSFPLGSQESTPCGQVIHHWHWPTQKRPFPFSVNSNVTGIETLG